MHLVETRIEAHSLGSFPLVAFAAEQLFPLPALSAFHAALG